MAGDSTMENMIRVAASSLSGACLFQFYWKNFVKSRKILCNDIVYCQRALKAHLKVHQMVTDVFLQQADADPEYKQRAIDELESNIFEINAEQQILILQLCRIINKFYIILDKNNIPRDEMATKDFITNQMVHLIVDESFPLKPQTVSVRESEQGLINRFFLVQQTIEILDASPPKIQEITNETNIQNNINYVDVRGKKKSSVLKKKTNLFTISTKQYIKPTLKDKKASKATHVYKPTVTIEFVEVRGEPEECSVPKPYIPPRTAELCVSKKVKMSRLNLQLALKKAHKETMAAKAAANKQIAHKSAVALSAAKPTAETKSALNKSQSSPKQASPILMAAANVVPAPIPAPKRDIKEAKTRNTVPTVVAAKSPEISHSSGDLIPERDTAPEPAAAVCVDMVGCKTNPSEFTQEMFLRNFNLYTHEVVAEMQQQRSKRKRRNIQSNEREDFHYERNVSAGKKRRGFLLSSQVKPDLEFKRPKRVSDDKNQEVPTSRSNFGSPNEKRCFDECLKGKRIWVKEESNKVNTDIGGMEQCVECKDYYHETCYHGEEEVVKNGRTKAEVAAKDIKLCPACKRAQVELLKAGVKKYQALKKIANDLNSKLGEERNRRVFLQKESKLYKTQLMNLLKIVDIIKSDQENDDSK